MAPSTFETLPSEILLDIFQWHCWDEVDLTLLSVSHHVRTVLLQHPVSRTLGALRVQRSKNQVQITTNGTCDKGGHDRTTLPTSKPLCLAGTETIDDLVKLPWCTDRFLFRIQTALIKHLIRRFWQPLLCRDGRPHQSLTDTELFNVPDDVRRRCHDLLVCDENVTYTLTDTGGGYPWTRVQVWPVQGRVLIRDQLLNNNMELTVCLTDVFESDG